MIGPCCNQVQGNTRAALSATAHQMIVQQVIGYVKGSAHRSLACAPSLFAPHVIRLCYTLGRRINMGFIIAVGISVVLWVGIYYGAKAAVDAWNTPRTDVKQEERLK